MIHIIIGDGQGKTTSSVGLAVRSAGYGLSVLFIQFLKDSSSGEIQILKKIPEVTVAHAPVNYGFSYQMTADQLSDTAKEYEKLMNKAILSDASLIVLDEVIHALNAGLVSEDQLRKVLGKKTEIVLTGRNAPGWLQEKADYVSEIRKIKHPYDRGISARRGIEY